MQIRKFLKNKSGASGIEYGLLTASITLVVGAAVYDSGATLSSTFCRASKIMAMTTNELFIGTAMAQEAAVKVKSFGDQPKAAVPDVVYDDGNGTKYVIKDGSKVKVEDPAPPEKGGPELKKAAADDCTPPSRVS